MSGASHRTRPVGVQTVLLVSWRLSLFTYSPHRRCRPLLFLADGSVDSARAFSSGTFPVCVPAVPSTLDRASTREAVTNRAHGDPHRRGNIPRTRRAASRSFAFRAPCTVTLLEGRFGSQRPRQWPGPDELRLILIPEVRSIAPMVSALAAPSPGCG